MRDSFVNVLHFIRPFLGHKQYLIFFIDYVVSLHQQSKDFLKPCSICLDPYEQDLCSPQRHNKSKVEIPNDFNITHREAMLPYTLYYISAYQLSRYIISAVFKITILLFFTNLLVFSA